VAAHYTRQFVFKKLKWTVKTAQRNLTLWRHCCHMGTAIKHPVPDRDKPLFIIFDTRALRRSRLSVRVPGCQKLQMTA